MSKYSSLCSFSHILHFVLAREMQLSLALGLLPIAAALPAVFKRQFTGPVINSSFPDPTFLQVDQLWYAFATNNAPSGFGAPAPGNGIVRHQLATSSDFFNWTVRKDYDALPKVGDWSTGMNSWAPSVIQLVRPHQE